MKIKNQLIESWKKLSDAKKSVNDWKELSKNKIIPKIKKEGIWYNLYAKII